MIFAAAVASRATIVASPLNAFALSPMVALDLSQTSSCPSMYTHRVIQQP
jgi:hypothetical protein